MELNNNETFILSSKMNIMYQLLETFNILISVFLNDKSFDKLEDLFGGWF